MKYKETKNGIICGYCGWKIDKPSDSISCIMRIAKTTPRSKRDA